MTTDIIEAPVTALTLPQRAAVALGTAEHENKLRELVKASADLTVINNQAGREQVHTAAMVLLKARTGIGAASKAATEDAKLFTKAVAAETVRLVEITEGEEKRLFALRDDWDEKIAAEKAAKIAAERARVEAIQARILTITRTPLIVVGQPSVVIDRVIQSLIDEEIGEDFEEFVAQAEQAKQGAMDALSAAMKAAMEAEIATTKRAAELQAAEAKAKAEREELAAAQAKLKADQDEQKRIAAEERAEQAERERIAQAALQAAQDKFNAEQAEAKRLQKIEDDRREASIKVQRDEIDRQQAELAEAQRKAKEAEAERVRLQALADQFLADHAEALAMNAVYVKAVAADTTPPEFVDPADTIVGMAVRPTDAEIISLIAEHFDADRGDVVQWLYEFDVTAAFAVLEA